MEESRLSQESMRVQGFFLILMAQIFIWVKMLHPRRAEVRLKIQKLAIT